MNGSGRWRAWARERAGRARRHPLRLRPVALTLLARDRAAAPVTARGLGARSSFSFPTHLHLSVHPTAERRVDRHRTVPSAPVPGVRPLVLRHVAAPAPAGSAAPVPLPRPPARAARPAPVHLRPVRRVEPPRAPRPGAERAAVAVRRRADELAVRLVHATRRVEHATRSSAVVHERGAVAGPPPPGAAPASRPAAPALPAAHAPHHAGAAAPLDLERLTDRIVDRLDARLVAHRERFGRAF